MEIHLSNSSLSAWQDCKLRWWLGNIRELGLPQPTESAAATGTLVHAMIEAELNGSSGRQVLEDAVADRGVLATDANVLNAWNAWQSSLMPLYEKADRIETEVLAKRKTSNGIIVSGVIDAVVETNDRMLLVDHKTSWKMPGSWLRANEMSVLRQLLIYEWLFEYNADEVAVDIIPTTGEMSIAERKRFDVKTSMRHATHIFIQEKSQEIKQWAYPVAGDIEGEQLRPFWYRAMSPGRQCEHCDYSQVCKQIIMGNPTDPEEMAEKVLVPTPRYGYRG